MGPAAGRYAMKPVAEPDAGNRHVRFDERGWETGRLAKPQATASILDSTPGYGPLRLLSLVAAFFAGQYLLGDQARVLPDRCLDAGCDVGIVAQERFCVLAALADALAVMGEP